MSGAAHHRVRAWPAPERGGPARDRPRHRARPHVRRARRAGRRRDRWVVQLRGGAAGAPPSRCQAISDVGVAPTHRRRGILRDVMRAVVDQARRAGRADRRSHRQRGHDLPALRLRRRHPLPDPVRRPAAPAAGRGPRRRRCPPARRRRAGPAPPGVRRRGQPRAARAVGAVLAAVAGRAEPQRRATGPRSTSIPRRIGTGPAPGSSSSTPTTPVSPTAPRRTGCGGPGTPAARTSSRSRTSSPPPTPWRVALVDYLLHVDLVTRVEWHAAPVDHPAAVAARRPAGRDGDGREGPPVAPPARRRPLPGGAHATRRRTGWSSRWWTTTGPRSAAASASTPNRRPGPRAAPSAPARRPRPT